MRDTQSLTLHVTTTVIVYIHVQCTRKCKCICVYSYVHAHMCIHTTTQLKHLHSSVHSLFSSQRDISTCCLVRKDEPIFLFCLENTPWCCFLYTKCIYVHINISTCTNVVLCMWLVHVKPWYYQTLSGFFVFGVLNVCASSSKRSSSGISSSGAKSSSSIVCCKSSFLGVCSSSNSAFSWRTAVFLSAKRNKTVRA